MKSMRFSWLCPRWRPLKAALDRSTPAFLTINKFHASTVLGKRAGPTPSEHQDLNTFLHYAEKVSLDRTSTVFVGTHYEYVVRDALARLGMSLERSGGRLDKGIDLLGSWALPSLPKGHTLRVLLQCKAMARKLGPQYVREMEGAFAGAPASWRITGDDENPSNVIALLVAPKEATKGVRDAMARSRLAMGFAMVQLDGRIAQIFWNKAAAHKGLDSLDVAVRRVIAPVTDDPSNDETELQEEIVLTWKGEPVVIGGASLT